jgi:hypothetical protein
METASLSAHDRWNYEAMCAIIQRMLAIGLEAAVFVGLLLIWLLVFLW